MQPSQKEKEYEKWSRRDSNPRPTKLTTAISTCLVAIDCREHQGQLHTSSIPYAQSFSSQYHASIVTSSTCFSTPSACLVEQKTC